jgi:hypothetical protein
MELLNPNSEQKGRIPDALSEMTRTPLPADENPAPAFLQFRHGVLR